MSSFSVSPSLSLFSLPPLSTKAHYQLEDVLIGIYMKEGVGVLQIAVSSDLPTLPIQVELKVD